MALRSYPAAPVLMARPASLPCPECEGLLTRLLSSAPPLDCMCGQSLKVDETREDPEHPLAPVVWRLRSCPDRHRLATAMFLVPDDAAGLDRPGGRRHRCLDCGASFSSLERQVSIEEATERLAHLARERTMLARAGRRFSHPRGRELVRLPGGRERRRQYVQAVRRAS